MAKTTAADRPDAEVRRFARTIEDRLEKLESQYSRALRKAGFTSGPIAALQRASPIAAVRTVLARKRLSTFWKSVEITGRELTQMNLSPGQIGQALQICDGLFEGADEFVHVRETLKFSTLAALSQACCEVREEEHREFYRLLRIEVESSSTDVLLRRLLEAVTEACGADAAHAYLNSSDNAHWEIRASTAKAPSRETRVLMPVPASVRKALATTRSVTNRAHLLDAGWSSKYQVVWSAPVGEVGVLQFGFPGKRELLPREVEMLTMAGERCFAATRKTRLLEDIAQREEQLSKLAIRMLMVEENERRRISRELHDDPGQSLVVIRLQMELIEQLLGEGSEERERLADARDITEKTILDIRRLISDLSPAVLEQLGLGAALRQAVNRFRKRYPCQVEITVGELPELHSNFQLVIYRLTQECLSNIAQHSGATAVNISLDAADRVLRLRVNDNGNGFDVEHAFERADSFGLKGIRERVAVLGGNVEISSTRKLGQSAGRRKKSGTDVRIEIPIP